MKFVYVILYMLFFLSSSALAGGVAPGQPVSAAVTNAAYIYKNANDSTNYVLSLLNATQATSTSTGGLICSGGVGIAKNLYVGGNGVVTGTLAASNLSGTNTGDQTITLTSDVTGTGTASFATTVSKIQGTTVSGTTGTGNVAFSASPTFTGTINGSTSVMSGNEHSGSVTTGSINSTSFGQAASSGFLKLVSGDLIEWRNNANTGNLTFGKAASSDNLSYNGNDIFSTAGLLLSGAFPILTSDVTTPGSSLTTTVAKIQGTTVSGTTGSTNVVFSTSPTLSGTVGGNLTFSGNETFSGTQTYNGAQTNAVAGAASTPSLLLTGAAYIAGTATTNKPILLIEDAATTNAWSATGTEFGVNSRSSFIGNLADFQINAASKMSLDYVGNLIVANSITAPIFTGVLSGSASSATNSTNSTNAATTVSSTNTTFYPPFVSNASTSNQPLKISSSFTFNPATGTIGATTFSGALSGNASTATAPATGTSHGAVTLDGAGNFKTISPGTSGNTLQSNGTDWISAAGGGGVSAWASTTAYTTGTFVNNGGSIYVATSGFTSGSTFAADVALGYWMLSGTPTNGPNLFLTGNNFEDNTVGGFVATGCGTITNGLPACNGSGAAAFSTSNGGQAKGGNTTAAAVTSSSPIDGTYSLNLATSGAGTIGDGYVSKAIPISSAYQARMLTLKFKYKVASGTAVLAGNSTNTYAAALYDVTNNSWLGCQGNFNFIQGTGVGDYFGTCQTASTTANVQVFVYSPVAPTGSSSLLLDNFYLGQISSGSGPAISDLVAYTPTFTGFGTPTNIKFVSKRIGDSLYVQGSFSPGTSTGVTAQITLGYNGTNANVTVDSAKLTALGVVGSAVQSASSTTFFGISVLANGGNNYLNLGAQTSTLGASAAANGNGLGAGSGGTVTLEAVVPIVGWSSNSSSSSDSDGRQVNFQAHINASTASAANSTDTVLPFNAVDFDTHGAFNTGTFKYLVPVTGDYTFHVFMESSPNFGTASDVNLQLYVNGASKNYFARGAANTVFPGSTTSGIFVNAYANGYGLKAGDLVHVNINQNSGGSITVGNAGNRPSYIFSGQKNGGTPIGSAIESIAGRYYGATATVTSSFSNITFSTKDYDSHGLYSGATITIQTSGKYDFTGMVYVSEASISAGQTWAMILNKNSSTSNMPGFQYVSQGTNATSFSLAFPFTGINCNAGDTITIQIKSSSTTPAITADNNFNFFTWKRVGN